MDGVKVSETDYTLDAVAGAVAFNDPIEPGSAVTADFTYLISGDITVTESANAAGEKWVASGSADVFDLTNKPVASSVILYANGLVVEPGAYSVNVDQKKVILKPGYVNAEVHNHCLLHLSDYQDRDSQARSAVRIRQQALQQNDCCSRGYCGSIRLRSRQEGHHH